MGIEAVRQFGRLTADQAKGLPADAVFLLPLGSVEPHGHLPLATDSMLAAKILERIADATADTWLLPLLPLGYLFKYASWPGGIGVRADILSAHILDLCAGLARIGQRRLLVVSGHDENREAALSALRDAHLTYGTLSVYFDWIEPAMSLVRRISSSRREGHASEIQTAVFQYLFPDIPISLPPGTAEEPLTLGADDLFSESECGTWVRAVSADAPRSYTGDPSAASPEKGRLVVEQIVERSKVIISELRRREPTPSGL